MTKPRRPVVRVVVSNSSLPGAIPAVRGMWVAPGGKVYGVCAECGSVVHVNKRLLGSAHFCAENTRP